MFTIPTASGNDQMKSQNRDNNVILEDHTTEIDLPVFTDSSTAATVTQQPKPQTSSSSLSSSSSSNTNIRRPIPVSTVDWQSTNTSQFIPMHSLDFLIGVDQLYIQQSIELNDLLSHVDSENRYTVKVPRGETLYYASETSTPFQRTCFGSSRRFSMRLYDQTQQEALQLKRRLACGSLSFCCCYLQRMEVWVPPGELVGEVIQEFCINGSRFAVYNRHVQLIYRIEGPTTLSCISFAKDTHFRIYSSDGATQLGNINYQWDQMQAAYYLSLQFPARISDTRHKALLLGATFLLEYLYFEGGKRAGICKCMC